MTKLKTTFVLFALFVVNTLLSVEAKSPYAPKQQTGVIYELHIDFGADAVFIHEVTKHKWYCEARAKFINATEQTNAYCVKREYENSPRPIR